MAEKYPASDSERVMTLYHQCSHLFHRKKGVHTGQRRVLLVLLRKGPTMQKELMELMEIRSASLSELMPKLEESGYIRRTVDEQDRRNTLVSLTKEGEAVALQILAERQAAAEQMFGVLTREERAQMESILSRLREVWRTLDDDEKQRELRG